MVQVFITVGLMIGFFMCYGTVNFPSSCSWRFPLAFQAIIALFLTLMSYFYLPQSPRWLNHKDRQNEAEAVWNRLGVSETEREKVVPQENNALNGQTEMRAGSFRTPTRGDHREENVGSLRKLFAPESRNQMLLAIFVMSMQQLSGIDGVLYVSKPPIRRHSSHSAGFSPSICVPI